MKQVDKKVDAIRTNLEKKRPEVYPIKEHPIDGCEEFVKKLYIDMLCVVAQYENEDAENQLKFIQRIHAGAGLTEPITENIKNAMEVTVERFNEFLRQCRENSLENIFIVDCLLTACADGSPNAKQVAFLAEVSEALGIGREHTGWLCDIAIAILEQDMEKYHAACENIPHDDRIPIVESVVCYLKEFVSGILVDTDELLWIYAQKKTKLNLIDICGTDEYNSQNSLARKKIIIQNIIVEGSTETDINRCLKINTCENVIIINSEFYYNVIQIFNCPEVNITDCLFDFRGYQYSCIDLSGVQNISIKGTTMKNSNMLRSQVIKGEITNNAVFENCVFENLNGYDGYQNGVILMGRWGNQVSIKNTSFNNCHTYRNNDCLMYCAKVSHSGCTFNNSGKLCNE